MIPRETVKALISGPEQSLLDAFKTEWAERVYARQASATLCRASSPAPSQTHLTRPTPARSKVREPLGRSWVRGHKLPPGVCTFGRPPAAAVRRQPCAALREPTLKWTSCDCSHVRRASGRRAL